MARLTPDLLSVFLVTATQAKGSVLIHQKMFESRLFFVDKLIDMALRLCSVTPHRAVVIGLGQSHQLRATKMTSPRHPRRYRPCSRSDECRGYQHDQ